MCNNVLHFRKRHYHTCWCIWIRKYNSSIFPEVIFFANVEMLIQYRPLIRNTEKICPYIVERISDIRKQDWFLTVKESKETHCKYIIRPYAYKHLIIRKPVSISNCAYKIQCCRIRIKSQCIGIHIAKHFSYSRRRRIWVFICIQFDHTALVWLLARSIRHYFSYISFPWFHAVLRPPISYCSSRSLLLYSLERHLSKGNTTFPATKRHPYRVTEYGCLIYFS